MDGMKREKGREKRERARPISFHLSPFSLLPSPSQLPAQSSSPISDNSFLIEEAYNQEPGVVQHINTFARENGGASWAYSFTQEWPLVSELYQLSYTVPVLHDEGLGTGVGDIALNFDTRCWVAKTPGPCRSAVQRAPPYRKRGPSVAGPAAHRCR